MTDDNRKEIIIDPAMFKVNGSTSSNNNRSKKQRAPPKIKIKGQIRPEKKNKASTLKRNLLRMIRGHQEKRVKDKIKINTSPASAAAAGPPKTDFEQSISFLSQINKSVVPTPPPKIQDSLLLNRNRTLRHNFPVHSSPPSFLLSPPDSSSIHPMNNNAPPYVCNLKKPNYGCLKNGMLPTYRVWKNQTQNRNRNVHGGGQMPKSSIGISPVQVNYESQLRNKIKEMSEIEQHQKLKQKPKIWKKPKKQKRILRRTFRIGKSKAYPVISVLVSNKTLRNETNLKHTELKEKPMSEVKQYLKKQGFIKVGTNTPNDVLREMFESASMICGELKNYSPENLLYNYFNND